jgi:hypothetical protein
MAGHDVIRRDPKPPYGPAPNRPGTGIPKAPSIQPGRRQLRTIECSFIDEPPKTPQGKRGPVEVRQAVLFLKKKNQKNFSPSPFSAPRSSPAPPRDALLSAYLI